MTSSVPAPQNGSSEKREVRQFRLRHGRDTGCQYPAPVPGFPAEVKTCNPPDAGPVVVHCRLPSPRPFTPGSLLRPVPHSALALGCPLAPLHLHSAGVGRTGCYSHRRHAGADQAGEDGGRVWPRDAHAVPAQLPHGADGGPNTASSTRPCSKAVGCGLIRGACPQPPPTSRS